MVTRVIDALNRAISFLAGTLLLVATLAVALQIAVRFLLTNLGMNISVPWTEELSRYCVTWSVFLGVAVLCRNGKLIAVDYLLHQLPLAAARVLEVTATVVTILFFALLVWLGWTMAGMGLHETSPVMKIPMIWVYSVVPLASILAIVNASVLIGDRVTHPPQRHAGEVME